MLIPPLAIYHYKERHGLLEREREEPKLYSSKKRERERKNKVATPSQKGS
jgi:hypothetical protein